jgi:hypothetical protein
MGGGGGGGSSSAGGGGSSSGGGGGLWLFADGPGHVAARFITTDLLLCLVKYFYHMFSVNFRNLLLQRRCFSFM